MRHQSRQLLQPFRLRSRGINLPQFRKEPTRLSLPPDRLIATMDIEWLIRINRRQTVRLVQLPAINKTVMTGSTLQIDPQKGLPNRLGKLDFHRLSSTDCTPPTNPLTKTGRLGIRRNQLTCHLIIRLILDQRLIEPLADLLAATGNKPSPSIIVPQQIVPKRQPMFRISGLIRQ